MCYSGRQHWAHPQFAFRPTRGSVGHWLCLPILNLGAQFFPYNFPTNRASTSLASTQTQQKSRGCFSTHVAVLHTK